MINIIIVRLNSEWVIMATILREVQQQLGNTMIIVNAITIWFFRKKFHFPEKKHNNTNLVVNF